MTGQQNALKMFNGQASTEQETLLIACSEYLLIQCMCDKKLQRPCTGDDVHLVLLFCQLGIMVSACWQRLHDNIGGLFPVRSQ